MDNMTMRQRALATGRYALTVCRWLALAAALGALCGALGALFHHAIDAVTDLRLENPWLLWLLPLGGLATLLLYRLCRVSFDAGTNLIITSVSTNDSVPILLAPLIVAGTTLSHLLGASVGREGAALQLGGSIGHNAGKLLRLKSEDVQTCAMCGMAACFSAMFGTPLAAAFFVAEVIRVGVIRSHTLLPCLTSSYVACFTAAALGAKPMRFALKLPLEPGWLTLLRSAGLAALCAVVSVLFCVALEGSGHLAKKYLKNPYLRIALGGLVMALTVTAFGLYDYAGAGSQVITRAVAGESVPWAFLLKIALTALCVGAGFRGGEIVPTLFVGATFGGVIGPLLGLDPGVGAAIGMIALFCSVVNCPMASLLLAAELFSTAALAPFAVAAVVAFVLSGRFGLYSSQILEFSKVDGRLISRKDG